MQDKTTINNAFGVDYAKILTSKSVITHDEITKILPHRYPFLLIDKIVSIESFKQIIAIKNVTNNEEFFTGHFPQMPIMPGVLIVEAMAQASGVLGIKSIMQRDNLSIENPGTVFLMSVDGVKFRQPVIPGDVLIIKSVIEKTRGDICICNCETFVLDKKVCEATITAKFNFNK